MTYSIRKAKAEDIPQILEIYDYARKFMAANGNPHQWGNSHPAQWMLEEDIREESLFVAEDEKGIHGVFFFALGEDPTYKTIDGGNWHSDQPYGVIHRIASDGNGGILNAAIGFVKSVIGHIRIDTHADNHIMQQALIKAGFQRCGIIYVFDGTPRIAFDCI